MWKLRSELCPKSKDHPTAKLDKNGKLVTHPEKLLKLYLDRLSHRKMKPEFEDILHLKNELWKMN
jgi:hypothetical protein